MNYIQVTGNVESVTYVSNNDSLLFIKDFFKFSDSYVEKCGGSADPSCNCFSVFESIYRADSLFLNNEVIIKEDESIETVEISYQSNGFRWNSERVGNTAAVINDYFRRLEMTEIELNGTKYFNIIALNNNRKSESLITKMYIQENNGLIGFILDEKTYTLLKN